MTAAKNRPGMGPTRSAYRAPVKTEQGWFPLDGTWHRSVGTRMSAVHLPAVATVGSKCDPQGKVLDKDNEYTKDEAKAQGRKLCSKCLRLAANPSRLPQNCEGSK